MTYRDDLILRRTPSEYRFVRFSNQELNRWNKNPVHRDGVVLFVGLRRRLHSDGVSDKAINAERTTEIAIVMANCWYNRPTMPGIKPTGTNTAARINAIATTGADMSFMAWKVAYLALMPWL